MRLQLPTEPVLRQSFMQHSMSPRCTQRQQHALCRCRKRLRASEAWLVAQRVHKQTAHISAACPAVLLCLLLLRGAPAVQALCGALEARGSARARAAAGCSAACAQTCCAPARTGTARCRCRSHAGRQTAGAPLHARNVGGNQPKKSPCATNRFLKPFARRYDSEDWRSVHMCSAMCSNTELRLTTRPGRPDQTAP